MDTVNKELMSQIIEGKVGKDDVREMLKMQPKDPERFWTYIETLQEKVSWDDPILLRLTDNLYIVRNTKKERVVKCNCGHELGDYRENWKTSCNVRVRETLAELKEVYYSESACPDPEWNEIREFYCPSCFTQVGVEVAPPGYPFIFEFLPDLDRLYRDFLGKPLEDESPDWYQNKTAEKTAAWAK